MVWPDPGDQCCSLAQKLTSLGWRQGEAGSLHRCGDIDGHTLAVGLPGAWVKTKSRRNQGYGIS